MRKAIALILFCLFSLGTFGVTIKQHLCCHNPTEKNLEPKHCDDDEGCCEDNTDCCDEIVSQFKIDNDFSNQDSKISSDFSQSFFLPTQIVKVPVIATTIEKTIVFNAKNSRPPPQEFVLLYCSYLI